MFSPVQRFHVFFFLLVERQGVSHTASQVEHPLLEFGGTANLCFKQTRTKTQFQGCTGCKRPIVIVKIVLPVTVVSFYIYVELLELVRGKINKPT